MSAKNGPFAALMLTTLWTATVWAGDLNAPAAPTDPGSAMYGLDDVYNRLDTGEAGAKRTGAFTEPVSGPGSTGRTLDEVMGKAPEPDVVNGVSPSGVLAGESYWSLLPGTDWGTKSGTMPNNGTTNYTPTITDQTIAEGYHDGTGEVAGDPDLVTTNIRSGTNIFGVAGDSNVVNTSSGDAVAGDIRSGKKAWVDGSEVTGILAPAAVERTGQTPIVPFLAPTGSDGALERGVNWPNPRFTNNPDGTVTDNLTGLIWLQNANCAAAARSWTQALADVNQLNTDGTMNSTDCGDTSNSTDWRLPNRRELESLIAIAYISPALSDAVGTGQWTAGDPFSGVQPTSSYWSSSLSAGNVEDAWIVHFTNGLIEPASKTDPHLVWPVRAGQ